MKIFLVMDGVNTGRLDVEDISVIAFSDENIAKEVVDKVTNGWIQKCEIDPDNTEELRTRDVAWEADFDRDGALIRIKPHSFLDDVAWGPPRIRKFDSVYTITLFAPNRAKAKEAAPGVFAYMLEEYNKRLKLDGYSLVVEVDKDECPIRAGMDIEGRSDEETPCTHELCAHYDKGFCRHPPNGSQISLPPKGDEDTK